MDTLEWKPIFTKLCHWSPVISMCSFLFPSYFYFYRNCKTYIKVFWMLLLPNKPSLCWPFAIPLKHSPTILCEGTWTILYWVFICLQDLYSWQQIHFSLRYPLTPADNTIKTSHLNWIPKPWQRKPIKVPLHLTSYFFGE